MVDADHQPHKGTDAGHPLVRPQLPDPLKPGKIESVDRHRPPPGEVFRTTILQEKGDAINLFVELSGG